MKVSQFLDLRDTIQNIANNIGVDDDKTHWAARSAMNKINEMIDEVIPCNIKTKEVQKVTTMGESSRIQAIEFACEILIGDESEDTAQFEFEFAEKEKALILKYREKLHKYIKNGYFNDLLD